MNTLELIHTLSKQIASATKWSKMALNNIQTPIIRLVAIGFVLGLGMAMPTMAQADTNTTTYYIPLPGYYVNTNGQPINGNTSYQYSCSNGVCTPTGTTGNSNTGGSANGSNANGSTPYYTACSSASCQYYGSQYPYPTYTPYAQPRTSTGSMEYQYQNYAYPEYVPYEKSGSTYKLGKAKTIPYYDYTIDGRLNNSNSLYNPYGGSNSGFYTTSGSNNGSGGNGGFIMTSN